MKMHSNFNLVNSCFLRIKRFNVIGMITFSLMLFFAINTVIAQTGSRIVVTGKIVDDKGEPLIGVNIVPTVSQSMGTITDMEGNYSIQVASDDRLKISYIGFGEKIVPIEGKTTLDITMEVSNSNLDEVVVTAYGTVKRANMVGAISSIPAAELEDYPSTSLTSLLDGKMSGVAVNSSQPSGRPGAENRIIVRGVNSFGSAEGGTKDPEALYVIDGIISIASEFDMLDPVEVESISVLKDASAAVYGALGSNGVVIVKTKRGKSGKMKVRYSGSLGIADATQQTEMLSAYDHASMINYYAAKDVPEGELVNKVFSDSELEQLKSTDYNWLDDAWKVSSQQKHSVSLSGGNDKVTYFGSGVYVNEKGNFDKLEVSKYSYRMGIDAQLTDNLKTSVTVSLDNKEDNMPYIKTDGAGNTMENIFADLLQAPRWLPHHIDGETVGNYVGNNPFALFETNSYKRKSSKGNRVDINLEYKFKYIDGLTANASFSRRENHSYSKYYLIPYTTTEFVKADGSNFLLSNEISSLNTFKNTDRISETYGYGQGYQLNTGFSYDKKIGLHAIKLFTTYEQSAGTGYGFGAYAENQQLDGVETQRGFVSATAVSDGSLDESGTYSFIGRVNYTFADKYLFESSFRLENSAKVHPSQRKGLFPMVALGWIASEEPFVKEHLSFFDQLKFRVSAGRTGRDYLKKYEYLLQYNLDTESYYFGSGQVYSGVSVNNFGVVSTGVSWEKSDMYNGGIDMQFLDNKLRVSCDAFYTYTFDILAQFNSNIPHTAGIVKMVSSNQGRLESWGYDMEISYRSNPRKDFKWNVKALFNYYSDRIIDKESQYKPNDFRYEVGHSTSFSGREQGYVTNGIIRTQEQLDAILAANPNMKFFGKDPELGMLNFQDIARPGDKSLGEPDIVFEPDGIVSKDVDKTFLTKANENLVLKNLLPSTVGFGVEWKKLSCNMNFSMAYGTTSDVYDKLARQAPEFSVNAPAFWGDYWRPDNTNAAMPDPTYSINSEVSSFWIRDVYQLRMRELNISYTLPTDLIKRWGLTNARVFFSGKNIWTPVSTFDYKEDAISRFNTYPYMKTFNFGLSVAL